MNRLHLGSILASAALLFAVGFTTLTQEEQRVQSVGEALESIVEIEVIGNGNELGVALKEATGTGFYIDTNTILTVAHVPLQAGVTEIKIKKYEGTQYTPAQTCKAEAGYRDESLDLMVLTTDCGGTPLKLTESAQVGQDVYMLGNLPKMPHTVTGGILSRLISDGRDTVLVANLDGGHGDSGSPLINSKGEVIGIVDAMHKDYDYMKFAISSSTINRFLNRANL